MLTWVTNGARNVPSPTPKEMLRSVASSVGAPVFAGEAAEDPLASTTPVGVPHSAQNLAPARSGEPHCWQPACSALPHSEQKRALGGAAAPHFEHVISGGALSMIPGRSLA